MDCLVRVHRAAAPTLSGRDWVWRLAHSSAIVRANGINVRLASTSNAPSIAPTPQSRDRRLEKSALARLPLRNVLRSYLIMGMSSSPIVLNAATRVLRGMVQAKSSIFDVDRNPLLRYIFRKTFYDQFCAGETSWEIQKTMKQLHDVGFNGIILEYALEVVEDANNLNQDVKDELKTINEWKQGLLRTVNMADNGDFVGLKWSGMGMSALTLLKQGQPPSPAMSEAMKAVCDAAATKGVKLLPAAEPQYAQAEVDVSHVFVQTGLTREDVSITKKCSALDDDVGDEVQQYQARICCPI
jgi:hypothetical protein